MSILQVEHLSKVYPGFILDDISFSLDAGTVTGFIGRNGAGKTTTIKAILNLIHPSAGEIRYFGLPLTESEKTIKQRIGYSTGTVNYYPRKKLRELSDITRTFFDNWDEAAYRRYLKLFCLDENKSPSELSEGMKVKCNLLLALSHRAELLILDEPTSGLDPFSRDELTELFLTLKSQGISIFFSTHITSDLEKCADNILYLRNGKLIAAEPKTRFQDTLGQDGETLEQTILRLEREARYE